MLRQASFGSAPTLDSVRESELRIDDVIEIDEPVPPGTVLGDRYVVGSILAEGGMGVVCLGRHRELGHLVAIKFLRRDICDRPSIVQRFLNEGKAAASLRSDHVVRVLDVGQLESGRPYLVMEHLEGEDLDRRVERDGPLDVDVAISYILEACAALAEAHAKGIVHRDIKPENIFLAYAGSGGPSIKVVDFGLAKRIDRTRENGLTGPRESMGSPCYMSPEQITLPQEVDERTDIWSLGVTLYRVLTGSVPFEGDTMSEVYAHILNTQPRPLYSVRKGLDSEIDAIVKRCLEKDVERRYQSVVDLSAALSSYVRRHRRSSRHTRSGTTPGVFVDGTPVEIPLRGPRPATILALLVLLFGAVAVFELDRDGRIDARALAGRAIEPFMAIDGVRHLARQWSPELDVLPDETPVRAPSAPIMRGPSGVCSITPSFDSSGRTLSAEDEHLRSDDDDPVAR